MQERTCDTCHAVFRSKQSLSYHQTKGVCCRYVCEQCKKAFKTAKGLKYHVDHNICRSTMPIDIDKKTFVFESILLTDILALEPDLLQVLYQLPLIEVIPKFIELVLFRNDKPDYWCIYITNRSSSFINVYRNNEWVIDTRRKIIKSLIQWTINHMTTLDPILASRLKELSSGHGYSDLQDQISCILYNHRKLISQKGNTQLRVKINIKRRAQETTDLP